MRQTFFHCILGALVLTLIFFTLAACQAGPVAPEQTDSGETLSSQLPEVQITPADSAPISSHISDRPFFVFADLAKLPVASEPFSPELRVIPLTNEFRPYGTHVYGSVAFIDDTLQQVALPEGERSWYYAVLSEYDGSTYGYVCHVNGGGVFVDAGGTVFPDFYPEPIWGADMSHYEIYNGYLTTAVYMGEEYRQLCGVMDLRTMREVLPPRYDAVRTDETTIWAILNGEEFLFDYTGNLLAQSAEHAGSYETEGIRNLDELWGMERQYRTLYLPTLTIGDGILAAYAPGRGLSIFTNSGEHLLSVEDTGLTGYSCDTDKFIIRLVEGDLLILSATGEQRQITLPSEIKTDSLRELSYEDGTLTFTADKRYVYRDTEGLLTELAYTPTEPAGCYTRHDEQGGYRLLSPDGEVLFPGGVYEEYVLGDSFILAYGKPVDEDGRQKIDVLNANGIILVRDVMGTNLWAPSFPGKLVVWLDESACVLLDESGTFEPIPPYTRGEVHRFGG